MSRAFNLIHSLGRTARGVLHVGANSGQEFADYQAANLELVAWVEADYETFLRLNATVSVDPRHIALHGLCGERDGERVPFYVASNESASSSMLDFGWHSERHPDVTMVARKELTTVRLDTLIADAASRHPDLAWDAIDTLVLDVQGCEMKVLYGADAVLRRVSFLYTEVNEGGMYQGDCSVDDVRDFVGANGFRMKWMQMLHYGYGDAFFAR